MIETATEKYMKLMYPKGRFVHYAEWGSGFQTLKLLCGRNTELSKVNLKFYDWASVIPTCKICLERRHEYA